MITNSCCVTSHAEWNIQMIADNIVSEHVFLLMIKTIINKTGSFFPKSDFLAKSEITVCKFEACFACQID